MKKEYNWSWILDLEYQRSEVLHPWGCKITSPEGGCKYWCPLVLTALPARVSAPNSAHYLADAVASLQVPEERARATRKQCLEQALAILEYEGKKEPNASI